jgi:hypothetical protein
LRQSDVGLEPPLEHRPEGQTDDAHISIEDNGAVAHLQAEGTSLDQDSAAGQASSMQMLTERFMKNGKMSQERAKISGTHRVGSMEDHV